MKIIETLKTRIYPKNEDITYFRKAFGIRRWLWNWGVEQCAERYNVDGKIYTAYDLAIKMNGIIRSDISYMWIKNVNSMIMQEVFSDIQTTYKMNFSKIENREFKSFKLNYVKRKDQTQSFRQHIKDRQSPDIRVYNRTIQLRTTRGNDNLFIKANENLNFLKNNKICNITIKEDTIGKFYAYITYERTNYKPESIIKTNKTVGIDMGIKTPLSAIDSDGLTFETKVPKTKIKQETKTDKIQSKLSKKVYNSKGYVKIQQQLQKSYKREVNIMQDLRNKTINYLTKTYKTIKIEPHDHTVYNGIKRANRALYRFGAYDFIERLKIKSELNGNDLIIIPQGEKTTQTCSICGEIKLNDNKLKLGDRFYKCNKCGHFEDRDLNAARNILKYV